MHIVAIIIGLVILYNLWDYIFYIIGSIAGLTALFFLFAVKNEKDKSNGIPIIFFILTLICSGISYAAFNYQVNSWHNPELIAQKQAQKEKEVAERAQAEAERKARQIEERNQKNIERANQLNEYDKEIFDSKFQEYINSGLDENSAREKALNDIDTIIKEKAEEQHKAEETGIKPQNQSEAVTVAQGRINIESLESVSANVLADQVTEYINANPDKTGRLINYIINLNLLSNKYDSAIKNRGGSDAEAIANSIPLIGGLLVDKSWDSFINNYKRAIVNEINNDTVMRNILDRYHEDRYAKGFITITDTAYNTLSNMYLVDTNDIENYNALIKIAAIKYHAVEAYAEEHKGRFSFDPDILDIIDIVSYSAFSGKENREKYTSSQQALSKICSALSIDLTNCRNEEQIKKYFDSLIPKYIFAYELEETYSPANQNAVFTENSMKSEDRRRVYEMLKGTWKSLITEKTAVIETFPENDYSAKTPRVNYIDVLDKKEPYARFDYFFPSGNRVKCFITPALYVKDGRRTKVLVMYSNYELIKSGQGSIYNNGRIENILSAEDVFIRETN